MCFRRRRVGALIVIVAAAAFTLAFAPSPGVAGSLDACAQRVIRDWYTGGRIDGAYPLACYRAAIRALPDDVLQYSNADQDIRRALAFARRGQNDPGNRATAPATAGTREAESADDHGEVAIAHVEVATAARGDTDTAACPRRERGRVARQQGADRRRDPVIRDVRPVSDPRARRARGSPARCRRCRLAVRPRPLSALRRTGRITGWSPADFSAICRNFRVVRPSS